MADNVPALMAGIGQSMRNLSERQRVVAQNIANSETPGYKAREVEAPDFSDMLAQQGSSSSAHVARPRITLSGGMASLGAHQPEDGHVKIDRDISEVKPDGNNVTLEDQLLKMGQIQTDFATMTNLYRKQLSLMKTALGRNGSGS
ncbi:MAG: flagellar basal-body rod protein FlgB [Alphaproteobacteria bacterium]|nr:flagellar basal-body rod protein FlgB [Alphaproteobacteria bacterium]